MSELRNCKENVISTEKRNTNSCETREADVHIANNSNGSEDKETIKNDVMLPDDDIEKDINKKNSKEEIVTPEDTLNLSEGKNELPLENDNENTSTFVAGKRTSNTEIMLGNESLEEPNVLGTEKIKEGVTNSKPSELAGVSDKKRSLTPDKEAAKKDGSEDTEKEENVRVSFPDRVVNSFTTESEDGLSQGKNENRTSLNIICDPVNITETDNGKDIYNVRSKTNTISKVSICKLL